MPGISRWESVFNKGTKDILDEERGVVEDAVAQGNLMSPEIYRLLGYEPVYDNPEGPDLGDLSNRLRDAKARVVDAQTKMRDLRHTTKTANGGTLRPKDKKAMAQQLKKERRTANQEATALEKELGAAQTTGRRIVGLKKLEEGPGDPTGSKDDLFRVAFNLENEALARALKGEEPLDATLKTAFDEKERTLRERLRRQLGPDYETTSSGVDALANFDRERGEAFKQYNMEATQLYAKLTSNRAVDLSNLTGQRIAQLLSPSQAATQRGLSLGQAAADRLQFTRSQQVERQLGLDASKARYEAEMAQAQARGEMAGAIAQGVGAGASGIGSAAGGMNFSSGSALSGASSALTQTGATRNDTGIADVQNYVGSLNLSA